MKLLTPVARAALATGLTALLLPLAALAQRYAKADAALQASFVEAERRAIEPGLHVAEGRQRGAGEAVAEVHLAGVVHRHHGIAGAAGQGKQDTEAFGSSYSGSRAIRRNPNN